MAEILVHASGRKAALPEHGWQRGDIVDVKPDGHVWGRMESKAAYMAAGGDPARWPGRFGIIKIPGLTLGQIARYLERRGEEGQIGALRRGWKFDLDAASAAMSVAKRREYQDTGAVTVTAQQAAAYLVEKA